MHLGREVKYLGVIQDSTFTWFKNMEYRVRKFYKAKKDRAHLMHSDEMSMTKKTAVL